MRDLNVSFHPWASNHKHLETFIRIQHFSTTLCKKVVQIICFGVYLPFLTVVGLLRIYMHIQTNTHTDINQNIYKTLEIFFHLHLNCMYNFRIISSVREKLKQKFFIRGVYCHSYPCVNYYNPKYQQLKVLTLFYYYAYKHRA